MWFFPNQFGIGVQQIINYLYAPHCPSFYIIFYIFMCLEHYVLHCLMSMKQWKYIHTRHWWSKYNIHICIQEHPCCIIECKSFNHIKVFNNQPIQKVHFQNKLILDCLIFDISTYKWKYVWCNSNTYLCVGLSHV